jgi:hypothetical protein
MEKETLICTNIKAIVYGERDTHMHIYTSYIGHSGESLHAAHLLDIVVFGEVIEHVRAGGALQCDHHVI